MPGPSFLRSLVFLLKSAFVVIDRLIISTSNIVKPDCSHHPNRLRHMHTKQLLLLGNNCVSLKFRVLMSISSHFTANLGNALEECENGALTLKTHQMFSIHTTPEKFENATITGHFVFVFEENSGRGISLLSKRHRFLKLLFQIVKQPTLKRKAGAFTFLLFEERFRKVPFS